MALDDRLFDKLLGFRFIFPTRDDPDQARIIFEVATNKRSLEEGFEVVDELPIVKEWYTLIADANHLSFDHPLVAEAYWVGSTLLERKFDFRKIQDYVNRRFSNAFTADFDKTSGMPHHNLHVFTYGLLTKPDATDEERESCLVIPARMNSSGEAVSLIYDKPLSLRDEFNPFEYSLDKGVYVAVHRGVVCDVGKPIVESILKYGFD